MNDRPDQSESTEFPLLLVAGYGLFAAFGIASVLLAPVPMILAHLRLDEPWPKLAAVIGAILAIALLTAQPVLVLVGFTLGLFVADAVAKEKPFPQIAATTVALAGALVLGVAVVLSQAKGQTLGAFWEARVDRVVEVFRVGVRMPDEMVPSFKQLFLNEGPFLLLGSFLMSLWLSIGLCAHSSSFPADHPCSGASLRRLRLPAWVAVLFFLVFLGAQFAPGAAGWACAGIARFLSFVFFIQGTIFLSVIFDHRKIRPRVRSAFYVLTIPGFLPVAALGIVGSYFFAKRLEDKK